LQRTEQLVDDAPPVDLLQMMRGVDRSVMQA